ncbi:hypothetical protein ACFVS2_07985 [Brevibacillus sp. NPDC058079]|uniref:hypothetical protein n=1 Tax=Brevibacillus sp. NPDC058079 TaxID=3346330 RepID=UPI0036E65BF9
MKIPYIGLYLEEMELKETVVLFYDDVTQISYVDQEKKRKAIEANRLDKTTVETATTETSDADEIFLSETTRETRSIENNDPDEFLFDKTTRNTFTNEASDPDEFILMKTTRITKTIEDSDPDEYYA